MRSRAVLATLAAAGLLLAALVALSSCGSEVPAESQWMSHVRALADDHLQGREATSQGYREASNYVTRELKRYDVEAWGDSGTYFQRVPFLSRRIDEPRSSIALLQRGRVLPVKLGVDALASMKLAPADLMSAPLVFAGYGLQIPDAQYDDLDGLDLKGAIVVYVTGAPNNVRGTLASDASYRGQRWKVYRRAGAVGMIEIRRFKRGGRWETMAASRFQPTLILAGRPFDEFAGMKLFLYWNGDRAERLFEGSKHRFADLAKTAEAGERLPRFELAGRLRAHIASSVISTQCRNVVGLIRGSDKKLRDQYVVLSAHLDHLGIGVPVDGDSIYNGAMDNASGCATLLEIARMIRRSGHAPRRSLVLLFTTAEESGLWGATYFAARPTVPAQRIVADLNIDMFLPIQPIRGITAYGIEESDLGDAIRRVAKSESLKVVPDPQPGRNYFIRSDQYPFIRKGIPAVMIDAGAVDSASAKAEAEWNDAHYHQPSDDAAQTIDLAAVARYNRYVLELTRTIADAPRKPRWNDDSYFRRFARRGR